ncbi:MAG: MobA/MobL family protein [Acidobacteria bacterium]|nr:MobA/MobL family protein [Acidobacteriota bacterium]
MLRQSGAPCGSVESAETRKNSQVAPEIVVALPKELLPDQRRQLVRDFVSEQCVNRGMVAEVAYHDGGTRTTAHSSSIGGTSGPRRRTGPWPQPMTSLEDRIPGYRMLGGRCPPAYEAGSRIAW